MFVVVVEFDQFVILRNLAAPEDGPGAALVTAFERERVLGLVFDGLAAPCQGR